MAADGSGDGFHLVVEVFEEKRRGVAGRKTRHPVPGAVTASEEKGRHEEGEERGDAGEEESPPDSGHAAECRGLVAAIRGDRDATMPKLPASRQLSPLPART